MEAIGWAGALALLAAYALLGGGRVAATSPTYRRLNAAGAAGLVVNGTIHGAWPSVALNLTWLAVGIVTVARSPSSGTDERPDADGRRTRHDVCQRGGARPTGRSIGCCACPSHPPSYNGQRRAGCDRARSPTRRPESMSRRATPRSS
ncbi:MAG: CBU_0592 family membrane protein [Phycicoccus sp.]